MKKFTAKLLATLLLVLSIGLLSSPLTFADDNIEAKVKDSSNFDVFEILSVDGATDEDPSEHLTQEIVDDAKAQNISPAAALILRAINILILLIGTFAFVMIVIGGLLYSTSAGDESQRDRGTALLTQSLLGLVIAFGSYFIVTFIQSFFY